MKKSIYEKYATLLVHYSLFLKPGESVYVRSTFLAEPLLQAFYAEALRAGATVEFNLDFQDKDAIYYENATDEALKKPSP